MSVASFIKEYYTICDSGSKVYLKDLRLDFENWYKLNNNVDDFKISSEKFNNELINDLKLYDSKDILQDFRDKVGYYTLKLCSKKIKAKSPKKSPVLNINYSQELDELKAKLDDANKNIFHLNNNFLKLNQNIAQMFEVILELRQEVASLKTKPKQMVDIQTSPRHKSPVLQVQTQTSPVKQVEVDIQTSPKPKSPKQHQPLAVTNLKDVLTNAPVLPHQQNVEKKKPGRPRKFSPRTIAKNLTTQ